MFRKVVITVLWIVASLIFAAYFVFAEIERNKGVQGETCNSIECIVLDSIYNRFVSKEEVCSLIVNSGFNPIGKIYSEINLSDLEEMLSGKSAIKSGNLYLRRGGKLVVEITQRRPILRLETSNGGFYIDEQKYIFPLVRTFSSYVPIVTGDIPMRIEEGYRGYYYGENEVWLDQMCEFGHFITSTPLWNSQIQQIEIENNGDINLFTRVGDQKIVFGGLNNYKYKFAKLKGYYDKIVPIYGWERYSEVNLKFSNQIVCTQRNRKSNHL